MPSFDGWAASRGVDPFELPFARFLNLVYYWATKDAPDQQALDKFNRKLWMPVKGKEIPKESPWSAENETASLLQFNAQVTGGVVINNSSTSSAPA